MQDGGGRLGFAEEAMPGPIPGRDFRTHDLESNEAFELRIFGLKHDPHAPLAQHLEHTIRAKPAQLTGSARRGEYAAPIRGTLTDGALPGYRALLPDSRFIGFRGSLHRTL